MQLMIFSKHLMGLPLPEIARRLRAMEIDAIDLTVRPGGHVEPERVEDDLPRVAEELAREGVRIGFISTAVTRADDARTAPILRTAATLGIHCYKLGYYPYQGFGTLWAQRIEVAAQLRDLAALNTELGLHGGFHNHSADSIGASLGDVEWVLRDVPPTAIGWYADPAHACIEGGSAGWLMGLDALQDRLTMLAVKDFRWIDGKQGYAGARRHSVSMCPLSEGNTPWPQVLEILERISFNGPVSLHGEYFDPTTFDSPAPDETLAHLARDISTFQQWRQAVQNQKEEAQS